MLTCGLLSVLFGKELCWDLANYHFYSPYAFIHGRTHFDFWPSSYIHQYINPAIDFLTYFLITHFSSLTTVFLLGAIHGLNFWLLFLIARLFLPKDNQLLFAVFLAALGMYGPTTLPGIGSFQNDNLISIFVLIFLLLQLKALENYSLCNKLPKNILFLSGFVLGLGIGLKLTAAVFALGGLLSILILPTPRTHRVKFALIFVLSSGLGVLITSGYWMLMMWQQHHNPFFPFFNNIFHSIDFPLINWRDERFLPKTVWQTLFFPFYFSWDGRIADAPFRDFRFLIVYIFFLFSGVKWLWKKRMPQEIAQRDMRVFFLYAFFIFSYIVWQYYFSISRYLAALELLAPLVIYLLVKQISENNRTQLIILTVIFYTLVFFMIPLPMARHPWYGSSYFNVRIPPSIKHIPEALVLISYTAYVSDTNPRPQSYLIPFFPPKWRFVGIPFWHRKQAIDKTIKNKIATIIGHAKGRIYLLTIEFDMPAFYRGARELGLKAGGPCEKIFSDRQKITTYPVLLCPVLHSAPSH